jgi:hypothetical protein
LIGWFNAVAEVLHPDSPLSPGMIIIYVQPSLIGMRAGIFVGNAPHCRRDG